MYKKIRDKVVEFIESEEGKVGIKTSLSLGLVGGSLILMQTMLPSAEADIECWTDDDCKCNKECLFWQDDNSVYHSRCVDA